MGIAVYAKESGPFHLGRIGENLATTAVFDVSKQLSSFEGTTGTFKILVLQDDVLSEVTNLSLNTTNKTLSWNVPNTYTPKKGEGKCQLIYTKGEIICKSEVYDFFVSEGFTTS